MRCNSNVFFRVTPQAVRVIIEAVDGSSWLVVNLWLNETNGRGIYWDNNLSISTNSSESLLFISRLGIKLQELRRDFLEEKLEGEIAEWNLAWVLRYWTSLLLPLSSDSYFGTSLLNSGPFNKSWSERFGPCEDGISGFSTFFWNWDKTLWRSNRARSIDFARRYCRFSASFSSRASIKLKPRRFLFFNFTSFGLIGSTKLVGTSGCLVRQF